MTAVVSTLDSNGWLRGIAEKADALLAYFLISDYSQSFLHQGQVRSLPYLIQQYPRNHIELSNEAQRSVEMLLESYFDSVDVHVTIENPDETLGFTEAHVDLRFNVTVRQDGRMYSLGRLINVVNNKIAKVTNITRT